MTFTEWVNHYDMNIRPLRDDPDRGDGDYDDYDTAYDIHLERLHDMVAGQEGLIDRAETMQAKLHDVITKLEQQHTLLSALFTIASENKPVSPEQIKTAMAWAAVSLASCREGLKD